MTQINQRFADVARSILACRLSRFSVFALLILTPFGNGYAQAKNHKNSICDYVASGLEDSRNIINPSPLFVNSIDLGGRAWKYQGVDLDQDGKPDDLVQSCGSASDGRCTLHVILSGKGEYELSEDTFKVIRYKKKYYVVVGDIYPSDRVLSRRLYKLTGHGANIVCASF